MLDQEFMTSASKLDGRFGTENVGPLLYAIIKMCRPRTLLEVGAGYSTLFILKALAENAAEDEMERNGNGTMSARTAYYGQSYDPVLITLDDYSHIESCVPELIEITASLGLDKYLVLQQSDFRGFSARVNPALLPFDFIWFDCGGMAEYVDFTNEYWPLSNPDGGIIMFHSTLTNLSLYLFLKKFEELQQSRNGDSFEILSMMEPHKGTQNSVTIIRKTARFKSPIYTIYP